MDHELRQVLDGVAHNRPTVPVGASALVLHEARLHADDGAASRAYAHAFAVASGHAPPGGDADHLLAETAEGLWKWERHGEFTTWTVVLPGTFEPSAPVRAPAMLADAPGERFVAAAVFVSPDAPSDDALDRALGAETPENERAGSTISGGLASVWTAFRIGGDGWTRFLFADRGLNRFRRGRVVRRLLEIEMYRIAALLAFPLAKRTWREIDALELKVGAAIAREDRPEGEVLDELIDASRAIERMAYETAFRFGAAAAYSRLVDQRLVEFREARIEGLQRLSTFLARRFAPAMDTCAATRARLETLAKRVERAAGMIRTRVDLTRAAQNQRLLGSMDDNARAQLRLQKAVEGFSVAAISYYAYSLLAKALAPGAHALGESREVVFNAALVVAVVSGVWASSHRVRKHL
ncbi:MAG TPA: DUF3422 domain-containing protein [Polyangiaceae bacterium]|nr:DUF3422 domain-containing protein [Polyangiaceae bacterium]